MSALYDKASLPSSPPPSSAPTAAAAPPSNKWGPYSGAGDFGTCMLIILAALFVSLLLAVALTAAIRFLFCAAARRHPFQADPEKRVVPPPAVEAEGTSTLVFSAGTRLAGAEAECAICLAEFVEGDGVRVLTPCNHGFHVRCIERWLVSRSTCPTCRSRCHLAVASGRKSPAMEEAA